MRLDRFLSASRIVDLKSRDFKSALLELLALCPEINTDETTTAAEESVLNKLLLRERVIPTHLDSSVALPHVRVPLKNKKYVFAVGRCPDGLANSEDIEDRSIRIFFLFLASEREPSYYAALSALARTLEDKGNVERLEAAPDIKTFRRVILEIFKGVSSPVSALNSRFNQLMLREAEKIAKGGGCSKILLFADTFKNAVRPERTTPNGIPIVVVTQNALETGGGASTGAPLTIAVRVLNGSRFAQLRGALFTGLIFGIISPDERVCCLGGRPGSDRLDIVLAVELREEFPSILLNRGSELLPTFIKAEVLERAFSIATRLAVEGREGKAVGCIIVIGRREEISPHTRPIILNPFHGHSEAERNILNPFMEETVKELAWLDGAIVVNGDGVIDSAGTMLTALATTPESMLASGLGSRHAAASSITVVADCVALAVSASTRQVILFRRGVPFVLHETSSDGGTLT